MSKVRNFREISLRTVSRKFQEKVMLKFRGKNKAKISREKRKLCEKTQSFCKNAEYFKTNAFFLRKKGALHQKAAFIQK